MGSTENREIIRMNKIKETLTQQFFQMRSERVTRSPNTSKHPEGVKERDALRLDGKESSLEIQSTGELFEAMFFSENQRSIQSFHLNDRHQIFLIALRLNFTRNDKVLQKRRRNARFPCSEGTKNCPLFIFICCRSSPRQSTFLKNWTNRWRDETRADLLQWSLRRESLSHSWSRGSINSNKDRFFTSS